MSQQMMAYGVLGALLVVLVATWFAVERLLRRASNPRIFISYRRKDGSEAADRVWKELTQRYGPHNVFIDYYGIEVSERYWEVLWGQLSASDVVVAVISPGWEGSEIGKPDPIRATAPHEAGSPTEGMKMAFQRSEHGSVSMASYIIEVSDDSPAVRWGQLSSGDVVTSATREPPADGPSQPIGSSPDEKSARVVNKPRILNKLDWVRREVEHGLKKNIIVVRVDDTPVPKYTDDQWKTWQVEKDPDLILLLEELGRQSISIPSNSRAVWDERVKLIEAVNRLYLRVSHKLLWAWYGLGLPVLLLAALGVWWISAAHAHLEGKLSQLDQLKGKIEEAKLEEKLSQLDQLKEEMDKAKVAILPLKVDLPYSLEAFINATRVNANRERDYRTKTVIWRARIKGFESPDSRGRIQVSLDPIGGCNVGNEFLVCAFFPQETMDEKMQTFLMKNPDIRLYGRITNVFDDKVILGECRLLPPD